uniref:10-deacetylbaccatin III 10-O-acetyltransferase n=1 Tax=Aegilops tauschii TaxID=37682 RepID=M8BCA7_AEGTA
MAAASLAFVARRGEPELVAPAGPTPRELKRLSDLDDQESLRFYRSGIYFYRGCPSPGDAPTRPGSYVTADADVTLDEFGDTLYPPVPCASQLLCLPESNSAVVVDRPLLYVQVTRLRCGGFVLGFQVCHNLADAPGSTQFLQALGELAGGMEAPSVRPVWARELVDARDPPCPIYHHPEYELAADAANDKLRPGAELVHRAFLFVPEELSSLRDQLPPQMRSRCSRFLLLSAFAWRCRTAALGYATGDEVRFMFVVNARGKRGRPLSGGSIEDIDLRVTRQKGPGYSYGRCQKPGDKLEDDGPEMG